jgi:putative ABC transport system permease protein
VDRLRALPGVRSVALTSLIPFNGPFSNEAVIPEGYQFPTGQENVSLFTAAVNEHYFDTMKTEVVAGRAFTADDKEGSRLVAIVTRSWRRPIGPIRIRSANGCG